MTLIRLGGCPGWSDSSLAAQSFWTPNLMIWEKLFVWEKLCLWLFKISIGMQHANLRSMACIACHCWNGMSAQFGYHSKYDLQMYTKHLPPSQLPGHQSITPLVAMTTQLWCLSACNAYPAPEIFIIYTSANFEKSKTQIFWKQTIFLKSINSLFLIVGFVMRRLIYNKIFNDFNNGILS